LTPNEEMSGPLGAKGEDTSRTLRWGKVGDVVHTLEDIPSRPVCDGEDLYDEQEQELDHGEQKGARRTRKEVEDEWVAAAGRRSEERVVRIASGLDFLVALKENGEVWCHRVKEGEAAAWEYVCHPPRTICWELVIDFSSFHSSPDRLYPTSPPSLRRLRATLP
jgi:SCF-associated factor 1